MVALMDDPEIDLAGLMEYVKGPDFPTGGIIMGRSGIRAAYATGRGKITLRGRAEIIEKKNGRYEILISEIPYMVNKTRLIESIADLVKDKRIEGISDIHDYSSRSGMHIDITLKRDANPQVVLNQLYTYTQLQSTFGVIMLALVNGEPKILTLKQILQQYIDYQCEIVTRRTRYDLKKAQERAHILEGLLTALDFIDEVIAILRASKSIPEGREALMNRFGLDEIQAQAIVQMRLGQLTGLERIKVEDEMAQLKAKIADFIDILSNESRILTIVREETGAIAEKFGDDRRTVIENVSGEVDIEDAYSIQHRGGRGVKGMTRREEDVAKTMFTCSTHDYVMFFTTRGRTYRLKGYEVPEGSRNSKGMNIVNLLPLEAGEKVSAMIRVPEYDPDAFLCMVTRKGIIKRTSLDAYRNVRKNGVIAINLDDDDELAWVRLTSGNDDLLIATRKGMGIRFNENDARPLGRTARGVKAIELREGDEVVGMEVLDDAKAVLTVSTTGYGRRSEPSDYRLQSRGGKGTMNYRTETYGDVAAIAVVDESEDVIFISSDGIIIRIPVSQISTFARPSKGVRVMRVSEGEQLVTVACTPSEEDQEKPEETAAEEVSPAEDSENSETEE